MTAILWGVEWTATEGSRILQCFQADELVYSKLLAKTKRAMQVPVWYQKHGWCISPH